MTGSCILKTSARSKWQLIEWLTHPLILSFKYLLSKLLFFVRLCVRYSHWGDIEILKRIFFFFFFKLTLTSRSLFSSRESGLFRMTPWSCDWSTNLVVKHIWVYIFYSCHSQAIWPWISYSNILNCSFLISKAEKNNYSYLKGLWFIIWNYLYNGLKTVPST